MSWAQIKNIMMLGSTNLMQIGVTDSLRIEGENTQFSYGGTILKGHIDIFFHMVKEARVFLVSNELKKLQK
jgi:hypothetical protein